MSREISDPFEEKFRMLHDFYVCEAEKIKIIIVIIIISYYNHCISLLLLIIIIIIIIINM